MPEIFKAAEILKTAIRIERNGIVFYSEMLNRFKKKSLQDMFSFLASEDERHRKIFEDMLSKTEQYEMTDSYPGEYEAYLRAFADEHVFSKDKTGQLMAKKVKDVKEAIQFGIEVELDSINYYQEIRRFVPDYQKEAIEKIIEEERGHFLKLSNIKRSIP
ncbi:MAG TPA: ferritin family protein [Candidatus Omnitrophota bacterium]|nr:ferritin family protein [Candidatus Omnitrophota bacterium]